PAWTWALIAPRTESLIDSPRRLASRPRAADIGSSMRTFRCRLVSAIRQPPSLALVLHYFPNRPRLRPETVANASRMGFATHSRRPGVQPSSATPLQKDSSNGRRRLFATHSRRTRNPDPGLGPSNLLALVMQIPP